MKKRIVSIILTLCMVLSFVPTTALAAEGTSEIGGLQYIDRGYENLEGALRSVGADIKRI